MFGLKPRRDMFASILTGQRRLGIYDTAGKRRYWLPLPPVKVDNNKLVVGPVPTLVPDESFVLGWLQIEDENGQMLVKFEINLSSHNIVTGTVLALSDLTISID